MTTSEPRRSTGYRGALPTRQDRLARPWLITVFAIFVLIFVLSLAGIPSRLFPEPTLAPTPSATATPEPSGSAEASGSAEPSDAASATESAASSASVQASPSAEASASP